VSAITAEKGEPFYIDPTKCVTCGVCINVCKFHAIKRGTL
jgi:NAD-dependent dihydropyrimidine dehydrogenase PreA subunit